MTDQLKLEYYKYCTDKLFQVIEKLFLNNDFSLKIGEISIKSKPSKRIALPSKQNLLDE